MKLFGFGKKSDKRTAKTLGPNLTELFGGEEGEEMVVEATESGLAAIDAAESRLSDFNTDATQLQADKDAAEAAQATAEKALDDEKSAHESTKDAFETFKKEPGAEPTVVEKNTDEPTAGHNRPESKIERETREAKEQGEKIYENRKVKQS